jgi:hypothetical protein
MTEHGASCRHGDPGCRCDLALYQTAFELKKLYTYATAFEEYQPLTPASHPKSYFNRGHGVSELFAPDRLSAIR